MDLMIGKTMVVKDRYNRVWGEFVVSNQATDSQEDIEISGYLEPRESFNEVKSVFLDYEESISCEREGHEKKWKNIVGLGAYLEEKPGGKKLDIGNIIFITENLLVSCSIKRYPNS